MLEFIQYRNACPPAIKYKRKTIDQERLDKLNNLIEEATNYVEGIRRSMACDLPDLYDKLDTAVKELQNG